MSTRIRISDHLVEAAEAKSELEGRSILEQIEYWAVMGRTVEANQDLPFNLIKETMLSIEAMKVAPPTEYTFG